MAAMVNHSQTPNCIAFYLAYEAYCADREVVLEEAQQFFELEEGSYPDFFMMVVPAKPDVLREEPEGSIIPAEIRAVAAEAPEGVTGLIGVGTQLTFNYGGTHAASIRRILENFEQAAGLEAPKKRAATKTRTAAKAKAAAASRDVEMEDVAAKAKAAAEQAGAPEDNGEQSQAAQNHQQPGGDDGAHAPSSATKESQETPMATDKQDDYDEEMES
eukprot:GDKI01010910.1.p2 GENE.GDKI01010910.1~~GDKI01010910.1.p2  ORF type:complete len:216 (-),score=50.90 GDKI01010910.1:309-956(-)